MYVGLHPVMNCKLVFSVGMYINNVLPHSDSYLY